MPTIGRGQIDVKDRCCWHLCGQNYSYINKPLSLFILMMFCISINCLSIATTITNTFPPPDIDLSPTSEGMVSSLKNVSCVAYNTRYHCNCGDEENPEFQLPRLYGSVYHIEITRCSSLTIQSKTIWHLHGLRTITISDVRNLTLQQDALALPLLATHTPLVILLQNVNVYLIDSHAIVGPIEEISFKSCQIRTIRPFALTVNRDPARLLHMDKVTFHHIDSQAFKKFTVEKMDLMRSTFNEDVPSKFLYQIEVLQTFLMEEVYFRFVHSRAFVFNAISKLIIARCVFTEVDAEWISAEIKESAILRDNIFGIANKIAFKGIRPFRDRISNEKLELRLSNITLDTPKERDPVNSWSLEFNEALVLNLKLLIYRTTFSCANDMDYNVQPPQPYSEFLRKWKDTVYFQNDVDIPSTNRYLTLSEYIQRNCQFTPNYWLWFAIGITILGFIIFGIIVTIILYRRKKKRRQRLKLAIVKPEPRTYKETQIIYQIENAGLLKTDL